MGVLRALAIYDPERGSTLTSFATLAARRGAQSGVVYANRAAGSTTGAVVGVQPFGGWKMSGISGKAAGGHYYLAQFLRERSESEYT